MIDQAMSFLRVKYIYWSILDQSGEVLVPEIDIDVVLGLMA